MTGPRLPDLPAWICQTCQLPVDMKIHPLLGSTPVHRPQDPDDHPVVAIRPPADYTGGECDFCSGPDSAWVLPAHSFVVPIQMDDDYLATTGDDGWSACEPCAELIRRDDWDGLLQRHKAEAERKHGLRLDAAMLFPTVLLWEALQHNITGPLRPIRKGTGA